MTQVKHNPRKKTGARLLGAVAAVLVVCGLGMVAKPLMQGGLAGATSSVAASVGLGALALAAMVTVAAASLNLFAANTAQMPPVITRTIESAQVVEVQKSMHINKEYEQNSRADGKKWVQVVNRPGRQPNVS